ncbi:hypothetical protein RHMOL_Rhmol10G0102400 [Rhododendron molle]|uniref:Uncharacterized protein n=1 Tax=Rhododendron molle TaxID=49168 RepID=A0ACC0M1X9_RHOML|nr:hypothetical protein RHMOL_Rhmol10G0102400 [Rhododendron molle]
MFGGLLWAQIELTPSLPPSHQSSPSPPRLEVPIRIAQVWTSFCNGFLCKVGKVRICLEETHWSASHFRRWRDRNNADLIY